MYLKVSEPYTAFSADTADADARRVVAARHGVPEERVEVDRDGGCVRARVREEED